MYTMCDGGEPWSPFGWCDAKEFSVTPTGPGSSQTKRPDHLRVGLSVDPAGTQTFSLRRYGAAFVDFMLGTLPENAYGRSLVLEFDADQVTADDRPLVVAWADTPGGSTCETRQVSYPASATGKTAVEVQIPTACDYATLVAVNTHTGSGEDASAFPVSWSTFATGVTIGNGTVTLGVNADGSLGLGASHEMACRAGRQTIAAEMSDYFTAGPAFALDATGFDAIRNGSDPCGGQPTEGWSVGTRMSPDSTPSWSKHALDYPDTAQVAVAGFSYTDTEATSVVRLGTHYTLKQRWHPSSIDSRVYQLDVTIQSMDLLGAPPLTYRQIVPLNIGRWHGEDSLDLIRPGGDGVADATTNLYWPWGQEYAGSIDDPSVPLPPPTCDYAACHGVAVDVVVTPSTSPAASPQFSMYYGFADTTTQASAYLDIAGATTRAIASTTDWNDETSALLVGLHRP